MRYVFVYVMDSGVLEGKKNDEITFHEEILSGESPMVSVRDGTLIVNGVTRATGIKVGNVPKKVDVTEYFAAGYWYRCRVDEVTDNLKGDTDAVGE